MKTIGTNRVVWAIAGAAWIANALLGLSAGDETAGFYATEAVWLGVHTLVLVGLVGLWRDGIVGESRVGRAGMSLAMIGRVVFLAAEAAAIVMGHDELPIFPLAVVSTGLGMLVAGIAARRGGQWRGWRAAPLIAMGAYPFALIFPIFAATGERPPNIVVALWGATFIGIAAALTSEKSDRGYVLAQAS